MCKCTPNIRTPYCGKGDCVVPGSKAVGTRRPATDDLLTRAAKWAEHLEWLAANPGAAFSVSERWSHEDSAILVRDLTAALVHLASEHQQMKEALNDIQRMCSGDSSDLAANVWLRIAALTPPPSGEAREQMTIWQGSDDGHTWFDKSCMEDAISHSYHRMLRLVAAPVEPGEAR